MNKELQSFEELKEFIKENEEPWEKGFAEYMMNQGSIIKKANGKDCCDCYEDDFDTAMMIASEYIKELICQEVQAFSDSVKIKNGGCIKNCELCTGYLLAVKDLDKSKQQALFDRGIK